MHYNPVSIALAERCVEEQEGLGAVVVESCESRWRRTQEVSPPGSIGRVLLPSEMLAAAEAALQHRADTQDSTSYTHAGA